MDLDLTKYTEQELLELNRRIIERIRSLRQGRCRESMAVFNVGDRVSFEPDCGHEVTGTIVRLNRKSVTVVASDGVQWRVAPGFVKKASSVFSRSELISEALAVFLTSRGLRQILDRRRVENRHRALTPYLSTSSTLHLSS